MMTILCKFHSKWQFGMNGCVLEPHKSGYELWGAGWAGFELSFARRLPAHSTGKVIFSESVNVGVQLPPGHFADA